MNYYEILEITVTATQEDIKISYRKLAKKYHPDLNRGKGLDKMKQINEAYATLSDTGKRRAYDVIHSPIRGGAGGSKTEYRYNSTTDPFEGFRDNPFGFDDGWTTVWANMQRKYQEQARQQKYYEKQRKPLTVKRIKEILYEEISQKRIYTDQYSEGRCDFCGSVIRAGQSFYKMMGLKDMCGACKSDILSHL